jgi:hypothetical protein
MWLHSWPVYWKSASPRRRPARTRRRCPPLCPAWHKPSLERLEDRSMPSVAPLPIPGGLGPFFPGEPFQHINLPGPADAPPPVGNEPSTITDFNGFIGVAHFEGTGIDNNGNSLLWDADLRFMTGEYQGVDGNLHHGTFVEV